MECRNRREPQTYPAVVVVGRFSYNKAMQRTRRQLALANLPAAVAEVESLRQTGYERVGNWTLGQACRHLSLDLQSSLDGYPAWTYLFAPLRPVIRTFFLPKILRFQSPSGVRTMAQYVPPENLDDEAEAKNYAALVERFLAHDGKYHTHPGFGFSDRKNLETVYSAHAAHHLSFLLPASTPAGDR